MDGIAVALPQQSEVTDWIGKSVVDSEGAELGSCDKLYADNDTGLVEWLGLAPAEGDDRVRLVPLVDAREQDGSIRVEVAREAMLSSPALGSGDTLTEDEEASLYRHYGIKATKSESDSLLPAGEGTDADTTDTAVGAEAAAGSAGAGAANAYGAPSTTAIPGSVQDDLAGTRETHSHDSEVGGGGTHGSRTGGSAPITAGTSSADTSSGSSSGSGADTAPAPAASTSGGAVTSDVRSGGSSGNSSSSSSSTVGAAVAAAALLVGGTAYVVYRRQQTPPPVAERIGMRPLLHDAQLVATRGLADAATVGATARGLVDSGRSRVSELAAAAAPVVAGTGSVAAQRARHGAELASLTARQAAQSGRELGSKSAKSGSELGKTAGATAAALGASLAREGSQLGQALSEGAHSVAETASSAAGRVAGTATAAGATAVAAPARLAHAVAEAADELEDDVERAWKKSVRRVLFVLGLGTGYVLGARDGRERYEEIVTQARQLTGM